MTSSFSKSSVFEMFSVDTKTQSRHFKFLWFEKRFHDGLVRTVGLTVAVLSNLSGAVRTGLDCVLIITQDINSP